MEIVTAIHHYKNKQKSQKDISDICEVFLYSTTLLIVLHSNNTAH